MKNISALFVRAASPGSVLRFIERYYKQTENAPVEIFLSDATPPFGYRALLGLEKTEIKILAQKLALLFPETIYFIEETEKIVDWESYNIDTNQKIIYSWGILLNHKKIIYFLQISIKIKQNDGFKNEVYRYCALQNHR